MNLAALSRASLPAAFRPRQNRSCRDVGKWKSMEITLVSGS